MSLCIISWIIYSALAFQVFRVIKFSIGYRKSMKVLKGQWVEICKTAKRQQKEYFEMMKNDDGMKSAYNNALNTVFNN